MRRRLRLLVAALGDRPRGPLLALAAGAVLAGAVLAGALAQTHPTRRRAVSPMPRSPVHVPSRRTATASGLTGMLAGQRTTTLPATQPTTGVPATHVTTPVPARELVQARQAAARFLAGYLPYLYGRTPGSALSGLTASLRAELARDTPRVTPAQYRRQPRLLGLSAVGQAPGLVLSIATVVDGGPAPYSVALALAHGRAGWLVVHAGS